MTRDKRNLFSRTVYDSGEGGRNLEGWRDLNSECKRIGCQATWQAPIICERFKVLYQQPLED